jgi:hypothetical protein
MPNASQRSSIATPPADARIPGARGGEVAVSRAGNVGLMLFVSAFFVAIASVAHGLAVRGGFAADTFYFVICGVAFWVVTAVSHVVLTQDSDGQPLVPLLASMAIRLGGIFVIFGCLELFSTLSRREAVFNVLFWYITLTATDLVGVVSLKNRRRAGLSITPAIDP